MVKEIRESCKEATVIMEDFSDSHTHSHTEWISSFLAPAHPQMNLNQCVLKQLSLELTGEETILELNLNGACEVV